MEDPAVGLIGRAVGILRILAGAGRRGASLSEISRTSGLPHSTIHRLLRQLIDERVAIQIESTRRYALGPMTFELGVAAAQYDLRPVSSPILARLAEKADDSVFLSLRSGDDAVCIDMHPGPSPIRVVTLEIGTRRPLGAGAGGLAILGALPADERAAVLPRVEHLLQSAFRLSPKDVIDSLTAFDRDGYSHVRNRIHASVSAVGFPIRGALRQPIAALSVAALTARITPARLRSLVAMLRSATQEFERALGH